MDRLICTTWPKWAKNTVREGSALCRVILRRFDVRESRGAGQGCGSYGRDLESAGAVHVFLQQKARYPLSVLLSRLPEAEPTQKLFAGLLFLLPLLALFGWRCLGGGDASHEKNKLPADR